MENRSLSLKDYRFNRISECAIALLYHLDDIGKYLGKFTNIVNGMSILDRTFADMEILKPIYAALGLLGIHILKPLPIIPLPNDGQKGQLLNFDKNISVSLK